MNTWTIKRVKDELPDVKIRLSDGRICLGRTKGRELDFAKVIVGDTIYDFAWLTIVNAMNAERCLRV